MGADTLFQDEKFIDRDAFIARLDRVRTISHNFGYGVGDDMDDLLAKYDRT